MPEEEAFQSLGLSKPATQSERPAPAPEDLQFHTAVFEPAGAGPRCALCNAAVTGAYYHLDGNVVCTACAEQTEARREPVRGRLLLKSVLYGAGAALAGSALYGIVLLATDSEFALLSILVGIMVAKAMMRASGGRGGRKLQIIAVLLTYGGITVGYIPAFVKEGVKQTKNEKDSKGTSPAKSGATPEIGEKENIKPVSLARVLLAIVIWFAVAFCVALAAPFLVLTQGLSGMLSVLILFFGLQQAWVRTKGDTRALTGPFEPADPASSAANG